MRMKPATTIRKAALLAGVGALVAFSGNSMATPLGLQDVPLFISTGAEPNVMLMVDGSGSMENIVPDVPYDPDTIYLANCPTANQVSAGSRVFLFVSSGSPRIRIGTNTTPNYVWGSGTGQRCFVSDQDYLGSLNVPGAGFLPAQYTGNYLNWYFNTATDPAGCSNTWSSGRKPCAQSRMMIAKTAGVNLVDSMPSAMRAGLSTYNGNNGGQLLDVVGDLTSTKRSTLKSAINDMTAAGNTPLAETLADIGAYFSRGATDLTLHPDTSPSTVSRANIFSTSSSPGSYTRSSSWNAGSNPVQYSCQKSFAVLLTDGRPTQDRTISTYLRDYSGDCAGGLCDATPNSTNLPNTPLDNANYGNGTKQGRSYEATGSDYLDDVAKALRDMDLRPDLIAASGATNKKNNVSTYLISFADDQAIDDPLMQSAASQGGGKKLIAGNEAELTAAFADALADIVAKTASASSASVNSGSISSDTRVYQAKFNSSSWTGQLQSFPVNPDGTLVMTGPQVWDASKRLPAFDARDIITVNTDATPVAFRWTAIDAARQAELNSDPTLLDYLRGSSANEGTLPANFRARRDADGPNMLGDIVASAPLFVGRPPFRYRDSLEAKPYSAFVNTYANRDGMVYVGANDGMLHGFDARTGAEAFAFIPSPVFSRLKNLASKTYAHEFFVDGSPSMGDVFFDNDWHTVLVGGLNKGGRGIYALDITDPSTLRTAENNPGRVLLWEFTAADDADLGLTYSQPTIVKLQDGRWAAVFGNGYNSPSGRAVLYVVSIEDGSLIKKFTVTPPGGTLPTWDNGLSSPALVDLNGDRKADAAYAGDLHGNMWKFDLSGASDSSWNIAFAGAPLYTARDGVSATANRQPITARPEVARGPQGAGTIVLFGTGKYLELADKLLTPQRTQTFYGIIDRGQTVADRDSLQAQTILAEVSVPNTDINVRFTTQNTLGNASGWYMDLLSPNGYQAEKQVTNPIVRDGKIVFTTLIPNDAACSPGGTSWLMEIDLLSGSRLREAPFDIDGNGEFTVDDIPPGGPGGHVSGIQGDNSGILQSPGVIEGETSSGGCVQFKYMPDSGGNIQRVNENCGPGGQGRQSWRQIR